MERSSYLLLSKRKRLKYFSKTMNAPSSTLLNVSADSLETGNTKNNRNDNGEEIYMETIMVPFYENDVPIKIPKSQKKNIKATQNVETDKKRNKSSTATGMEMKTSKNSYLINHLKTKKERNSYLEAFRKRFPQFQPEEKIKDNELDSLYPEFGDTERESIGDESCPNTTEFYNTEVYNELFYEKLLAERFDNGCSLNSSSDDRTVLPHETMSKQRESYPKTNTRNQYERPRRPLRRRSTPPMTLKSPGGLGPDMEKIRPRLERARSLQRYSEKVRMQNKLKIYKKSVQQEKEKTDRENLRQLSEKRGLYSNESRVEGDDFKVSYLLNRAVKENVAKEKTRDFHESKAKSADVIKRRNIFSARHEKCADHLQHRSREPDRNFKEDGNTISFKKENKKKYFKDKGKYNQNGRNKCVNTEKTDESLPVQINFSVNVGRMKPNSDLRALEEKHRVYQEKVKSFMVDYHVDA